MMEKLIVWPRVSKLNWRARNAAVEAALRTYLALAPDTEVLTTMELAEKLAGPDDAKAVATILSKLAKWMPKALATHDGETFRAYGKLNKRWRWHGQAQPDKEWEV